MQLLDYDYALIRLDAPLNFTGADSHLVPICMPTPSDATRFDNMTCVGSGWGLTDWEGEFIERVRDPHQERTSEFALLLVVEVR